MKLPVANIDCIDPFRTATKQDIGESAGTGSEIGANPAGRIDAKLGQRVVELLATAAHEPLLLSQRDLLLGPDGLAGCPHDLTINQDVPGHYQRPSPRPGFCKLAFDHGVVQSLPRSGHRLVVSA
jgi:hypothetical protein